jgi:diguanylate cyclase (GGDEF)-like protein
VETDLSGDTVVLAATRALLSVRSREEAAAVLLTAIRDLGGAVVPARLAEAHRDALPMDVSLGVGEPMLVVVPELSVAALQLGHHLPTLLQDAGGAADRCDVVRRQAQLAAVDPLTGVSARRLIETSLSRARPDDVVCMLDLDGFKELNDAHGHEAGDRALQEFAELLRGSVRSGEFCGRYGGDEFLLILSAAPVENARGRLAQVFQQWRSRDWHSTTASAGIAVVGSSGGLAAGRAADLALLEAKRSGRDRIVLAPEPS